MDSEVARGKFPHGWHRTFYTLWLGAFITGMGYSMTMPFISLFIAELGNFTRFQLNIYSGLAFGVTFISQAIVSPFWGSLADRKGRKLMCMRASGVMACTICAIGFAQSVWMIIGMRFLQGVFSGYINNATALMAGETPHNKSGWSFAWWFPIRIVWVPNPIFHHRSTNVLCLSQYVVIDGRTFYPN